ncbi:hypothetical protein Tco_0896258 [Tanacetum coccineum]
MRRNTPDGGSKIVELKLRGTNAKELTLVEVNFEAECKMEASEDSRQVLNIRLRPITQYKSIIRKLKVGLYIGIEKDDYRRNSKKSREGEVKLPKVEAKADGEVKSPKVKAKADGKLPIPSSTSRSFIGDHGISKVKEHNVVSGDVREALPRMAPEPFRGKSHLVTDKIRDRGLSKVNEHTVLSGGVHGSLPSMAPEPFRGKSRLQIGINPMIGFGPIFSPLITIALISSACDHPYIQ